MIKNTADAELVRKAVVAQLGPLPVNEFYTHKRGKGRRIKSACRFSMWYLEPHLEAIKASLAEIFGSRLVRVTTQQVWWDKRASWLCVRLSD